MILRSWSVRIGAGTGRSRRRLRSRHSAAAVFMITSTAGEPGLTSDTPVVRSPFRIQPQGVDHCRQ